MKKNKGLREKMLQYVLKVYPHGKNENAESYIRGFFSLEAEEKLLSVIIDLRDELGISKKYSDTELAAIYDKDFMFIDLSYLMECGDVEVRTDVLSKVA